LTIVSEPVMRMTGSDDEAWSEDDVSLLPLEHAVEHRLKLTPTARAAQNVVTGMNAGASLLFIFFLLRSRCLRSGRRLFYQRSHLRAFHDLALHSLAGDGVQDGAALAQDAQRASARFDHQVLRFAERSPPRPVPARCPARRGTGGGSVP
jgi:hypothetical protein